MCWPEFLHLNINKGFLEEFRFEYCCFGVVAAQRHFSTMTGLWEPGHEGFIVLHSESSSGSAQHSGKPKHPRHATNQDVKDSRSVDAVVVGIVMGVGMRAAGAEAIVRSRSSTRSRSSAAVAVA